MNVLVTVIIAVRKHCDQGSLQKEECVWVTVLEG